MYRYFGGLPFWIQGEQIEPTPVTLAWLLLLVFRLERGHSGTQYFHFHLVGNTKLNGITLDAHDRAEEATVRDDLVPILERAQHFLGFLLAPLRREDQQHVKNHHDDQKRGEGHKATGARPLRHYR
jgi:hypothetical protein